MAVRVYATLGRAPDNNVVIDHPTVSNHHARLSWAGTSLLVEDLSSVNGTFVDGQRIKSARTRPGAEVRIGQVELPWSHEGLRELLKAGAGARTLVLPGQGVHSFVCGNCGELGAFPPGPIPKKLRCPKCNADLRTATKPKGSGRSYVTLAFFLPLLTVGAVGLYRYIVKDRARVSDPQTKSASSTESERERDATEPVVGARAEKIAAAIDPMDPLTRNTAVRIAARREGPFHVEQVAEIWSAVRQPWRYVNDPEGREYFARTKETLENGYVGDCDDFAIALVSMITAIGGKARVVLMDGPRGGHAYAEACVQGEPSKVASALTKHYRNKFKRYIDGKAPAQIAFRTSDSCPIWLNLDWNAAVPGGPYGPELWAVAVYEDGRTENLAPASPVTQSSGAADAPVTHANEPARDEPRAR